MARHIRPKRNCFSWLRRVCPTRAAQTGRVGGREGIALMLALLFVVLLTVMVVEYTYEAQVEATFATNHMAELQAYTAASSAVMQGLATLDMDMLQQQEEGFVYDSYYDAWGQYAPREVVGEEALGEESIESLIPEPLNNALMFYTISDEYGKIPLNALIDPQTEEPREYMVRVLDMLFEGRNIEQFPTDAIVDWIDYDADEPFRQYGAESSFYSGLEPPYGIQNRPMDAVEELLLVAGITPEVYFGDPEQDQIPLSELFTVYGDPRGFVNGNTAPREVLEAYFFAMENSSGGMAEEVIQERQNQPFENRNDFEQRQIITIPPELQEQLQQQQQQNPNAPQSGSIPLEVNPFVAASQVFRIRGYGLAEGGQVKAMIEAYVYRDVANQMERFRILDWRITL